MSKKLIQAAAGAGGESVYVEDVFSTYLYTGTGSAHTIQNGIDLTEGGLVWTKSRGAHNHSLHDSERGVTCLLKSNATNAEYCDSTQISAFTSNGFTVGTDGSSNTNGRDYASWTFRKQAGFFDVITWTGDGSSTRTLSHDLDANIGAVIIKGRNESEGWIVAHRSTSAGNKVLQLNTNSAETTANHTYISGSTLTVGTAGNPSYSTNDSGINYVAYLFAHDDQSFGDDSDESIIKCGSFTTDGSGLADVNLGWEPQWILVKPSNVSSFNWYMNDSMRPWLADNGSDYGNNLYANLSNAEGSGDGRFYPTATGFSVYPSQGIGTGTTCIYIAIRRPMKTPEAGTDVFAIDSLGGTSPNPPGFNGVLVDWAWKRVKNTTDDWYSQSRLLGTSELKLNATDSESTSDTTIKFDYQDGWLNSSSTLSTQLSWMFKRATGFFDVVAYSPLLSDPVPRNVHNHNLGVKPELIIVKQRTSVYGATNWSVGLPDELGVTSSDTLSLNLDVAKGGSGTYNLFGGTQPTATQFTVGYNTTGVGVFGESYIAYLFATLAGVSKVGSYTGTGTTNNIDCGFNSSARFVMVKRTSSTGDWYVWDSARGITVGSDPFLKINTTDAEGTTSDIIQPYSSGFTLTSNAGTAINGSGSSFIFLAIA